MASLLLRSFGNKTIIHQRSLCAVVIYQAGSCIGNNCGCRQRQLGAAGVKEFSGTALPYIVASEGKHGMQFIIGVILFVVVIGTLDAGLPWPRCGSRGA